MLELFHMELEAHAPPLFDGLHAKSRDAAQLQTLMRCAHSIKGAARIVGLEPLADLAHDLEHRLQTATKVGSLPGNAIVALQQAADFFHQLAKTSADETPNWLKTHADEPAKLKDALLKTE